MTSLGSVKGSSFPERVQVNITQTRNTPVVLAEEVKKNTCLTVSYLSCILLIAAGITVGIWAAFNE